MAAQTKFRLEITEWDVNGNAGPSVVVTKTFSSLVETSSKTLDLAASGTLIVWNPTVDTSEQIQTFDYLYISSDKAVHVELTTNEGAATEELSTIEIPADGYLLLFSDTSYHNHSASDAFAGTLDVIDKIRIKEPNGVAAKVTVKMGR